MILPSNCWLTADVHSTQQSEPAIEMLRLISWSAQHHREALIKWHTAGLLQRRRSSTCSWIESRTWGPDDVQRVRFANAADNDVATPIADLIAQEIEEGLGRRVVLDKSHSSFTISESEPLNAQPSPDSKDPSRKSDIVGIDWRSATPLCAQPANLLEHDNFDLYRLCRQAGSAEDDL